MREALAEELSRIIERYRHSTRALELFVNLSLDSIVRHQSETSKSLDAVQRALRGEFKPGPDTVTVQTRHLELFAEAVSETERYYEPHPQMLLEMSLIYASALFDAFISDTLITILQHIPERLRSGRALTVEEALRFHHRSELIQDLARREVQDLMYKNIEKQFDYFRTSFGVDTFANQSLTVSIADLIARRKRNNQLARTRNPAAIMPIPQDESLIVSITELAAIRERRNLIAHNNGLATAKYISRFETGLSVGEPVVISVERTELDRVVLSKVATTLVFALYEKLVLKVGRESGDVSGIPARAEGVGKSTSTDPPQDPRVCPPPPRVPSLT